VDAGGILFSDKATWEIMTKMLKNLSRNGGKYGSLENVGIGIYLYREREGKYGNMLENIV
jgi:hypothetical protein